MGLIVVPEYVERRRQPQVGVRPNRASRLVDGWMLLQAGPTVLLRGVGVVSEVGARVASKSGIRKTPPGTVSYDIPGETTGYEPLTIVHFGVRTGSHSGYGSAPTLMTWGASIAWMEFSEGTKQYGGCLNSSSSPTFVGYSPPTTSTLDAEEAWVFTVLPGGMARLYRNGVEVASASAPARLLYGGRLTIRTTPLATQDVLLQGIFQREWSANQVRKFVAAPHALFA